MPEIDPKQNRGRVSDGEKQGPLWRLQPTDPTSSRKRKKGVGEEMVSINKTASRHVQWHGGCARAREGIADSSTVGSVCVFLSCPTKTLDTPRRQTSHCPFCPVASLFDDRDCLFFQLSPLRIEASTLDQAHRTGCSRIQKKQCSARERGGRVLEEGGGRGGAGGRTMQWSRFEPMACPSTCAKRSASVSDSRDGQLYCAKTDITDLWPVHDEESLQVRLTCLILAMWDFNFLYLSFFPPRDLSYVTVDSGIRA